jgi:hypothetical protein
VWYNIINSSPNAGENRREECQSTLPSVTSPSHREERERLTVTVYQYVLTSFAALSSRKIYTAAQHLGYLTVITTSKARKQCIVHHPTPLHATRHSCAPYTTPCVVAIGKQQDATSFKELVKERI